MLLWGPHFETHSAGQSPPRAGQGEGTCQEQWWGWKQEDKLEGSACVGAGGRGGAAMPRPCPTLGDHLSVVHTEATQSWRRVLTALGGAPMSTPPGLGLLPAFVYSDSLLSHCSSLDAQLHLQVDKPKLRKVGTTMASWPGSGSSSQNPNPELPSQTSLPNPSPFKCRLSFQPGPKSQYLETHAKSTVPLIQSQTNVDLCPCVPFPPPSA